MKRLISVFAALCITFSCLALDFTASAASVPGDANGDGRINSADALLILRLSVGSEKMTDAYRTGCDINLDGTINSADALMILKKSVGAEIPLQSFSLSTGNRSAAVGEKFTVAVTKICPSVADNTAVTWKTSDKTVAKVSSSGTVEALKAGRAVITATSKSNKNISASFELTVGVKATGVTLDKTSVTLTQGTSYTLKATIAPSNVAVKKLKWTSSDEKYVRVTGDGVIKAERIGSAKITCTTTDGTNKSASCTVKVTAMKIPYVSQLPNYPTGCEAASCCMLLKYYGFKITIDEMVKLIPRKNLYRKNGKVYGPDINEMFVGDPRCYYTSSTPGYGVFAPAVTKALQKAIDQRGGGYTAVNLSGGSFDDLLVHIRNGEPAIIWATYMMNKPTTVNEWYIETTGKYFSYPRGTHVMILSGHSPNEAVTVDPYDNGVVTFDIFLVEDRFNLLGKQAIILKKNK